MNTQFAALTVHRDCGKLGWIGRKMLNFQQTGGLMRWIDKLERRWGRYGIPNLMNIILVGQLIAWVIVMVINQNFYYAITLNRASLMSGQIWRVVTFLFVPPLSTGIQLLLTLYFRWWVGNSLQRAWGDFRFMVYILVGMVGALIACLITGSAGASGIFLSLFFAYAWMWPEQQVLLFFILPIKMKWMGIAAAAMWVLEFLTGNFAGKVSLLFGIAGFLAFFGGEMFTTAKDAIVSYKRRKDWEKKINRK